MQSITPLLSRADRECLRRFICVHEARLAREAAAIAALEENVETARSVEAGELPAGVVTLYSQVRLQDMDTGRVFIITVAPPPAQSVGNAPFWRTYAMAALLGAHEGDEVVWRCVDGLCRARVEQVLSRSRASASEPALQSQNGRSPAERIPMSESEYFKAAQA